MIDKNKYGLPRYIPSKIRRDVRNRSKFGCVICRCGFYQYEHIIPSFKEAKKHDAASICCLCGSCHDAVTRGHFSKEYVERRYRKIQRQPIDKLAPPVGPLDFHSGTAELLVGGLAYAPAVQTILRYHGHDVFRVEPGAPGFPGQISAIFTDDLGQEVMRLEENEWIGSLAAWDIEVIGQRLTVRRKKAAIVLQLRLDPPGRIVIERLDMRMLDSHVLITEKTYAIGRYLEDQEVYWFHANVAITRSSILGSAIEFADPKELDERDRILGTTGVGLSTADRNTVMNSNIGIMCKPLGIVVASLCGGFKLYGLAHGKRNLNDMRNVILTQPDQVAEFIGTGQLTH